MVDCPIPHTCKTIVGCDTALQQCHWDINTMRSLFSFFTLPSLSNPQNHSFSILCNPSPKNLHTMTQAIDSPIDTEQSASSTLATAAESPITQKGDVLTKSLSTSSDQQSDHKQDEDYTDNDKQTLKVAPSQDSTDDDQMEEGRSSDDSAPALKTELSIPEPDQNETEPESEPLSSPVNLVEATASSAVSNEIFAVVAQDMVEDILPAPAADTQTETEPILPTQSEQPLVDEKMIEKEEDIVPPRSFSPAYSCSSPSPSPSPVPSPALSRVSSRQDLRRKSSFFNSKEIVVSNQRYSSTATYDSMRPIADPRFKSRFQNVLSQWKARSSNN